MVTLKLPKDHLEDYLSYGLFQIKAIENLCKGLHKGYLRCYIGVI
jgi:hypothetical protein